MRSKTFLPTTSAFVTFWILGRTDRSEVKDTSIAYVTAMISWTLYVSPVIGFKAPFSKSMEAR